ncbi:hypothetical protein [Peterkaempfera bronchialis]|uniref:hypothetical protein n=1 Tax=Peterkaempfera bronchialis TaxID=2126346 RepID=UPI001E284C7F|nr:hypothetical protein [Peterkaempfera bronchialis]
MLFEECESVCLGLHQSRHDVSGVLIAVPYIASWSGEKRCTGAVVEDRRSPGRIAYRDERPDDRDEYGVLWARADSRPTRGRPQYGLVHPRRQRHAMRNLRCQVCDGPADTDERGTLWLLGDDRGDWPGWPEEMAATTPPLCLPCARLSVRLCPHLRGRHIAVRVRNPEIAGVYGALYLPRPDRARPTAAPTRPSPTPTPPCAASWPPSRSCAYAAAP